LGQAKSTAGVFVFDLSMRLESQAGQYSSRLHQSSLKTRAICGAALYWSASSVLHCKFIGEGNTNFVRTVGLNLRLT
jgi:hypothetical protein